MEVASTSEMPVIGHYPTWHHTAEYFNLQYWGFYMHKTASPQLPDDAVFRHIYVIQSRDIFINK
jgi:hypothetical protein